MKVFHTYWAATWLLSCLIFASVAKASTQQYDDATLDHISRVEQMMEAPKHSASVPSEAAIIAYFSQRELILNPTTAGLYKIIIEGLINTETFPLAASASFIKANQTADNTLITLWFNEEQQTFFSFHTRLSKAGVEVYDFSNHSYETRLSHYATIAAQPLGMLKLSTYGRSRQHVLNASPDTMWQEYDKLPDSIKNEPALHNALIQEMSDHLITDEDDSISLFYANYFTRLPDHDPMILLYHYLNTQNYKKAKPYLARLKSISGAHPWIATYELGYALRKSNKKTYRAAYELLQQTPDSLELYSLLLDHFVSQRMFEDALLILNIYYTKFDTYFDTPLLNSFGEDYKAFAASPQFKQWLEDNGLTDDV